MAASVGANIVNWPTQNPGLIKGPFSRGYRLRVTVPSTTAAEENGKIFTKLKN
jgi:hypothetical protein